MTKFVRTAISLAAIGFTVSVAQSLRAQDIFWTGQGANNLWSTPNNWDPAITPLGNQDLKFAETNARTANVNDIGGALVGYSAASLEFTAAGPAANTSGATVNAAAYTLTGNPLAFFNAGSANTITNNSTHLQTLSFADGGFGGIDVFVPNVSIIANNGQFLITSNIALNTGTVTFDGAQFIHVTGVISSPFTPEGVIKNGTGDLELDGSNTYTGGTTINNGSLAVGDPNALGVPNPNIFGPLNDVTLNGGQLQSTSDAPLVYNVPGDFNHNGGTLFVQIGSNVTGVNNDEMLVFGAANLDPNNSHLFVHKIAGPNQIFAPGDTVTIISTNNGVFGQFSDAPPGSPAPNDFGTLIQPFAVYNPFTVDLVFDFAATFASVGKTPNQIATGQALDAAVAAGCVVPATTLLGNLPINSLRHIYDLIAPEELASMYEASFAQGMVTSMNLQRRMDDIRAGATGFCNEGFTIQDNHGYTKNDGKSVADKNPAVEQQSAPDTRWGSFITGSGELTKTGEEGDNAAGYQLNQAGFTMGVDYRATDHWAIGLSGGYTHTTGNLVDNGRLNTDGGRMGLYSTYYTNGFYVDAAASGGWNQYDTRRTAFQGQETGSTDGAEFNGMVAVGYDWTKDCWKFGPVASFEYDYVQFNSFTESDTSLLPLHYSDQDENAYRSNLGFRIAHQQNMKPGEGLTVVPELRAAWRHDFGPSAYAIDSNFVGCPDTFTVHGPWIGRDSAVVNLGLTAYCTEHLSAYIFYDGQFGRDNYNNNGISGGFRVAF